MLATISSSGATTWGQDEDSRDRVGGLIKLKIKLLINKIPESNIKSLEWWGQSPFRHLFDIFIASSSIAHTFSRHNAPMAPYRWCGHIAAGRCRFLQCVHARLDARRWTTGRQSNLFLGCLPETGRADCGSPMRRRSTSSLFLPAKHNVFLPTPETENHWKLSRTFPDHRRRRLFIKIPLTTTAKFHDRRLNRYVLLSWPLLLPRKSFIKLWIPIALQ